MNYGKYYRGECGIFFNFHIQDVVPVVSRTRVLQQKTCYRRDARIRQHKIVAIPFCISVLYLRSVPIFAAEKRNFDAVVHISSLPSHIPFIYPSYTLHIASLYLGCSLGVLWTFLRRTLNLSTFFLPTTLYLPKEYFIS